MCDRSSGSRAANPGATFYGLFFFQAEDGIRDIGVTGVQTCALPILVAQPQLGGGVAWPGLQRGAVDEWGFVHNGLLLPAMVIVGDHLPIVNATRRRPTS